jgi:hypothetical protein
VFNNIYIIAIGNNLTNVLDKNGNKIFGGEYTKLQILNGYIYIKQGNLNGIASLKGEILIKPIKSKIFETSETFYYIDEQKNKIVVKK